MKRKFLLHQERAHNATQYVFSYNFADPHRESVRVRIFTTVPVIGARAPWSRTFLLFRKRMESAQRKKPPPGKSVGQERGAAQSLRSENLAGHYPPRNSLPAVAQTGRPLTPPAKISPCGHWPPFKWAGKLHQCLACVVHFSNAHPLCLTFLVRRCGARHISKCFCTFCAGAGVALCAFSFVAICASRSFSHNR